MCGSCVAQQRSICLLRSGLHPRLAWPYRRRLLLLFPQVVAAYNADPAVHGILVQLPLPKHINEQKVLDAISIEKVGARVLA